MSLSQRRRHGCAGRFRTVSSAFALPGVRSGHVDVSETKPCPIGQNHVRFTHVRGQTPDMAVRADTIYVGSSARSTAFHAFQRYASRCEYGIQAKPRSAQS